MLALWRLLSVADVLPVPGNAHSVSEHRAPPLTYSGPFVRFEAPPLPPTLYGPWIEQEQLDEYAEESPRSMQRIGYKGTKVTSLSVLPPNVLGLAGDVHDQMAGYHQGKSSSFQCTTVRLTLVWEPLTRSMLCRWIAS